MADEQPNHPSHDPAPDPSWTVLLFGDLSGPRVRTATAFDRFCEGAAALGGHLLPQPSARMTIERGDEPWTRVTETRWTALPLVRLARALLEGSQRAEGATDDVSERRALVEGVRDSLAGSREREAEWVPPEGDDDATGPDPLPDAFWLPSREAAGRFLDLLRDAAAGERLGAVMMGNDEHPLDGGR